MKRFKIYGALLALAGLTAGTAFTGCKNGNLFGSLHKRGSGDALAQLSDGKAALARREFANAKAYFESVLAKEPRNSEALYGAATASFGTAGLDLGTLLANVVTLKNSAPSPVSGLGEAIQTGQIGAPGAINQEDLNSLSILKGLNLDNLSDGIDQIVCFLLKIRSGNADGKISPADISLLMSVGITCIIRGILRPLEVNVLDLRQTADGTGFDIVIIDGDKLKDLCADGTIQRSIQDLAGALQAVQTAVKELNANSSSTVGGIELDLRSAVNQFKQKFQQKFDETNSDGNPNNNIPSSCNQFVQSFNVNALTPPTQDPGDCLNKDTKPNH
jgi:hypothetical protein